MASLLPFRALRYARQPASTFIPGRHHAPRVQAELLVEYDEPWFFVHEQRFAGEKRVGLVGLLNRAEAKVYPHEETIPGNVAECANEWLQSSSIHLWCRDESNALSPLLAGQGPPVIETRDHDGSTHTIRRVEHGSELQLALKDQDLFIADGHHRYAAGWNLATIQIRTPTLRTRAAHRLLPEPVEVAGATAIGNLQDYWAATPRGFVRFGVVTSGQPLRGLELPHEKSERNVSVLRRLVLGERVFRTAESIEKAQSLVSMGVFPVAFLVEPLAIDKIETDARAGRLLPPKSTDFYPKLAGGLLMARHQNENVSPAVAQRPGVRNASS